MAAHQPRAACTILDADILHADGALVARIRDALASGAPAVVVLCAAGEPLLRARERLRALDRVLAPLAAELSARVSRSATDGLAAWAASLDAPIGVDVQCAPVSLEQDLLDAALHTEERGWLRDQPDAAHAFTRLWAGKEAVLKAFGVGLAWSPREVLVLPLAPSWHAVQVPTLGHAWFTHVVARVAPAVAVAVALNAGHLSSV